MMSPAGKSHQSSPVLTGTAESDHGFLLWEMERQDSAVKLRPKLLHVLREIGVAPPQVIMPFKNRRSQSPFDHPGHPVTAVVLCPGKIHNLIAPFAVPHQPYAVSPSETATLSVDV